MVSLSVTFQEYGQGFQMSPLQNDTPKAAASKRQTKLMCATFLVVAVGLLINLFGSEGALGETKEFPVPPPALSMNIYPCSRCHDNLPVNATKRKLVKFHTDIILKPPSMQRWCTDCHSATNLNKLKLSSGELIDFNKSYQLCGQCHGTIYRDWKAGIHGKRVGMWNGDKLYRLCVSCHDPHQPAFKSVKPEPPPLRPLNIRSSIK